MKEQLSILTEGRLTIICSKDATGCHQGGEWNLVKVKKRDNESFSQLMRRFRKKVTRSKVLSENRKRRFFTSKSEERRLAKKKAIRKLHQKQF